MVATPAIRNLIREEKIHQIYSAMQAGQKFGMQTMNQSLPGWCRSGKISREEDAVNRTHASPRSCCASSRRPPGTTVHRRRLRAARRSRGDDG